ncbi:argininosuccinate lyase [Sphingomonas sp. MMS12-HWE2-04]|uniref:argininosuccinate lyase n=1 Tax=Sphingomonas sp. MMS12-HWE2-04 TaxID=3234199 RepID=UPI00384C9CC8
MTDTGRIGAALSPLAASALAFRPAPFGRADELALIRQIDRAHLVMLAETGLISSKTAPQLLTEIDALAATGFAALETAAAPRGLYLLYEAHFVAELGDAFGGALHTARSRNDLNATLLRLRLRTPVESLIRALLRLIAVLLAQARRFADTLMPIHTHGQPALPGSYGHSLAGFAQPLLRSAEALTAWLDGDFAHCPLGAGAAGGTSLAIEPKTTARLLGFAAPVPHAIDAVAARDFALRLLGEAAIVGTTLSRMALDLQSWASPPALVDLPDTLVGSSSMMPQKRNPYLLEHIQGRASRALGAFTAAIAASHAAPYSNNIAAGTEAMTGLWDALADSTSAGMLMEAMVRGARPRAAAMQARAEAGLVEATEIANRLVRTGMSFRRAHHLVGATIRAVLEADPLAAGAEVIAALAAQLPEAVLRGIDPRTTMIANAYGGGPGSWRSRAAFAPDLARLGACRAKLAEHVARWRDADAALDAAATRLISADKRLRKAG